MTTNTNTSRLATCYFLVAAPGHYGDRSTVLSSHRTLAAARRACSRGEVVREGALRRGDIWLRSSEPVYPIVARKEVSL